MKSWQASAYLNCFLAFVLLFAALHVSQHETVNFDSSKLECQDCCINHLPCTQSSPARLVFPLLIAIQVIAIAGIAFVAQPIFSDRQARAPPLR
jgi:hypothetical protein